MDYVAAIAFALFVWWVSTGAVLYLIGMPRQTFPVSVLTISAASGLALLGLWATSDDVTVSGAFGAFSCGLAIWAWHEMTFLMGYVTGPRKTSCPESATGWSRFVFATQTLIYHELAILATAALVILLTWDAPNQVGTWTFITLWIARLSAKLNVFLGVPNLTEEFLPPHLQYLKTYFRRRPMNLLFPLSVTVSTVATCLLAQSAALDGADAFEVAALTLMSALMLLVVIEHWFLVLPLPAAELWSWGLESRKYAEKEQIVAIRISGADRPNDERFGACPRAAAPNA